MKHQPLPQDNDSDDHCSAITSATTVADANLRGARASAIDAIIPSEFDLPRKSGMYNPAHEHDACGIGFVAQVEGRRSHRVCRDGA